MLSFTVSVMAAIGRVEQLGERPLVPPGLRICPLGAEVYSPPPSGGRPGGGIYLHNHPPTPTLPRSDLKTHLTPLKDGKRRKIK
jgi:hypothetical protein